MDASNARIPLESLRAFQCHPGAFGLAEKIFFFGSFFFLFVKGVGAGGGCVVLFGVGG
jgi:hypothetical protein